MLPKSAIETWYLPKPETLAHHDGFHSPSPARRGRSAPRVGASLRQTLLHSLNLSYGSRGDTHLPLFDKNEARGCGAGRYSVLLISLLPTMPVFTRKLTLTRFIATEPLSLAWEQRQLSKM